MNTDLSAHIANLLYEEEGSSLDFKSAQYHFYDASEAEKSELLKDILAFSNAWRRTDAFILIGVMKQSGEKGIVIGIKDHLADADIQQFINDKTNRPVDFSYHACQLEGKGVEVIQIHMQERPTYLRKRYVSLDARAVILRRGSSTAIASPEEVASMGAADSQPSPQNPVLDIVFLNATTLEPVGKDLSIEVCNVAMPDEGSIPDYGSFSWPFSGGAIHHDSTSNRSYYRDIAAYVVDKRGLHELTIQVENHSDITAHDVTMQICVEDRGRTLRFMDQEAVPDAPSTDFLYSLAGIGMGVGYHGYGTRRLPDSWVIDYSVGKIQPQADAQIPGLYVGAGRHCRITLACRLFADNLPTPLQQDLHVAVAVSRSVMSLEELLSKAKSKGKRS
jgi:hypothetical protein